MRLSAKHKEVLPRGDAARHVTANLNDEHALITLDQGTLNVQDSHLSEIPRYIPSSKVIEYKPAVHEHFCGNNLNRLANGLVAHDDNMVIGEKQLVLHDAVSGHKGVAELIFLDVIYLDIPEVVEA